MEKLEQVLEQAGKCLNCKNPMCRKGCPISTNIPAFITKIKENNFLEAYKILQENNIMSEICSTVCPVENQCMGSCIKGLKGEPIHINYLEKFINDWAKENNISYETQITNTLDKKVAVIGSGPAGLSCAVSLRKYGFHVTVFEKEDKCGGILNYGIPDFRLSKQTVKSVMNKINKLGIEIKTGIEFGTDISIESLKSDGYDIIFLGMGAQTQSKYLLTDQYTENIYDSDIFLKIYNNKKSIKNLGTTIIIGGGNVALDCARVATRMGAKEVYIIYRKNKELMPVRKLEMDAAIIDGVNFIFQTKVIKAIGKNHKISKIECIKTENINNTVVEIQNSNYEMKANTVIFAIGSKANEKMLNELGIKTDNGLICIDENYMTNIDNIYAGGDLVEKKSSVCKAIATGKKAANAIFESNQ